MSGRRQAGEPDAWWRHNDIILSRATVRSTSCPAPTMATLTALRAPAHPGGRTPPAQSWSAPERVGWRFVTLYALSYTGGSLLFLAPLLVSLALKVNDLVGIEAAPRNLAMVTGIGSLFSIVANPLFGRLSDRTTSRVGMRRPWMVTGVALGAAGTLTVATATSIDGRARRLVRVSGVLQRHPRRSGRRAAGPGSVRAAGDGLRASRVERAGGVGRRHLPRPGIQWLDAADVPCRRAPWEGPPSCCSRGGCQTVASTPQDKPAWSLRQLAGTFYVNPRRNPDFAWAFLSRFLFVMAYAFLVTYQAYYLLAEVGSAESDVPRQVYLGTVVQSLCLVVVAPLAGRLSDRVGRRKPFVMAAAVVYAAALVIVAASSSVRDTSWPWPSAASGSACTWPSTWPWWSTC